MQVLCEWFVRGIYVCSVPGSNQYINIHEGDLEFLDDTGETKT